MNKVILTGRITKDIELKYTTTSNAVVSYQLAVRKNKDEAYFVNCVAYGKTAELLNQYCKKGTSINCIGSIRTRNYDDKDGKRVYITEVVVEEIEFASQPKQEQQQEPFMPTADELPF